MGNLSLWERYKKYYLVCEPLGIALDVSRMKFSDAFPQKMDGEIRRAFAQMDNLEAGAIANPDENRMVGHYWLRDSSRAPQPEIKAAIDDTRAAIKKFVRAVHSGKIKPRKAPRFTNLLVIGIGGSALGPQFVAKALGSEEDPLQPFFFDNTDPAGMDRVLAQIGGRLKETLVIVISKSGGTKETRNGMLEVQQAFTRARLPFASQAVAITQAGSLLDKLAEKEGWLARFPMWDWVGGRTSETSAVGLLPAALQGLPIDELLDGARQMDEITRRNETLKNPAALLALMWHYAGGGVGAKAMVILPYKDSLELFSKYLQQLVMESLGKEKDLGGKVVNQGLAVYGNKGSTDQHAYVQQLRDGLNNFFVTFIEVLKDRDGKSPQVEPDVTSGDFLSGFFQGTRQALYESNRESITITLPEVNARAIGALIALYERTVGFYATLININAYHQPGVEAGKKAAGTVISLQNKLLAYLKAHKGEPFTLDQLAAGIGAPDELETIFKILQHAAANKDHRVRQTMVRGADAWQAKYNI
jgi:glucose-6-phosphate isomerase